MCSLSFRNFFDENLSLPITICSSKENYIEKSHILGHALKPGSLNLRTVLQVGPLFLACHYTRKRDPCYMLGKVDWLKLTVSQPVKINRFLTG
jgi:hypothetical protein